MLRQRKPHLPYGGMLNPADFNRHFKTCFYEPGADLAPFVQLIWIVRWTLPPGEVYRPEQVLSGPTLDIFFKGDRAFVQGIIAGKRDYEVTGAGMMAGVKFNPGGFYPFWQRSVADLSEKTLELTAVFPQADKTFVKDLLAQDDETAVPRIEALLRSKLPRPDKNVEIINRIMIALHRDDSIQTVADAARTLRMSERSLQLLFQTYVGVGLKWVIMRKRVLLAAEHARTLDEPNWAAIAADLGYSSQQHFVTDFKRLVGQSPSRYLRDLQKTPKQR